MKTTRAIATRAAAGCLLVLLPCPAFGQEQAPDHPRPPINADYLDYLDSTDFAAAAHSHAPADVIGLDGALAAKADVDHVHPPPPPPPGYANVIVVAKSGGDFTDPVAAVASIEDASESNPYVVRILPGVYDLGGSLVYLKPYVALVGSGRDVTVLTGTTGSYRGVVYGAVHSSVRHLTVENRGGNEWSVAVTNYHWPIVPGTFTVAESRLVARDGTATTRGFYHRDWSAVLEDVEILVDSATGFNAIGISGDCFFLGEDNSALLDVRRTSVFVSGTVSRLGLNLASHCNTSLKDVEVAGAAVGIAARGVNRLDVTDVQVDAESAALQARQSQVGNILVAPRVRVRHSSLSAPTAIYNGGSTVQVAATLVDGALDLFDDVSPQTTTLVGCYDADFAPIPDG